MKEIQKEIDKLQNKTTEVLTEVVLTEVAHYWRFGEFFNKNGIDSSKTSQILIKKFLCFLRGNNF